MRTEKHDYLFRFLIAHLGGKEDHDKIFQLIERRPYLVRQATYASGFQAGSQNLEEHVLPAAIAEGDWQRFLRYSLVALNLREIASALAEEPILRSLVRLGHQQLARNLVGQVADPLVRVRGRAVILATAGPDPESEGEIRRIVEDLGETPALAGEADAEAWLATLRTLARLLDPARFRRSWPDWIGRLEPGGGSDAEIERSRERVRQAWRAVAESWIGRDAGVDSGVWQAIAAMDDPEGLASFLPRRLAAAGEESYLDRPLPPPFDDDRRLLCHVRLALLARRRDEPETLERAWALLTGDTVRWTPTLAEAGRELWSRLGSERLRELAGEVEDPVARAALLVVALEVSSEESGDLGRENVVGDALRALEAIEDGAIQLPWVLRYLKAEPPSSARKGRVWRVARHLERCRYAAGAEDLARFFDLVAAELPAAELHRQLESFSWSPSSSPARLRKVAAAVGEERAVAAIFERAEELAAAVGTTSAEGFGLRGELLLGPASRLFVRTQTEDTLREAARRLLPEEEDRLWEATVEELMGAYEQGVEKAPRSPEHARELAGRIRSPRRRFLARLRATTGVAELEEWLPADELPARLYAAVATTGVAEDELHALAPLRQPPLGPAALAREHLDAIGEPDRRIRALIDLAHHALTFQCRRFPSRRDPEAALQPLAEAVGGPASAEGLLALTPELAAVGARAGAERGVAELQEATLRILRLEAAAPEERLEVLAALIARAGWILLSEDGPPPDLPPLPRCRAVASFFRWLVQLPERSDVAGDGSAESRERWSKILPVLLATADHLPPVARAHLLHPVRTRLLLGWFPTFTRWVGVERAWNLLRRVERLAPAALRRRFGTPWIQGASAFGSWTTDDQRPILELYFEGDGEKLRVRARGVVEDSDPGPREVELLAHLLAARAPEVVPDLLNRLPPGAELDALCRRLVRHRWLPAEQVEELFGRFEDGDRTLLAMKLWHGLGRKRPDWVDGLAKLLGTGGLGPFDPDHGFLRRRLRRNATDEALRPLAEAIRESFQQSGKDGGERALRWWLDAYLGAAGGPGRFAATETAIRRARSLGPLNPTPPTAPGARRRRRRAAR